MAPRITTTTRTTGAHYTVSLEQPESMNAPTPRPTWGGELEAPSGRRRKPWGRFRPSGRVRRRGRQGPSTRAGNGEAGGTSTPPANAPRPWTGKCAEFRFTRCCPAPYRGHADSAARCNLQLVPRFWFTASESCGSSEQPRRSCPRQPWRSPLTPPASGKKPRRCLRWRTCRQAHYGRWGFETPRSPAGHSSPRVCRAGSRCT